MTTEQIKALAGEAVRERLAALLGEHNALAAFPAPTGASARWAAVVTEMRAAR
jgi:hypothetical protein